MSFKYILKLFITINTCYMYIFLKMAVKQTVLNNKSYRTGHTMNYKMTENMLGILSLPCMNSKSLLTTVLRNFQ